MPVATLTSHSATQVLLSRAYSASNFNNLKPTKPSQWWNAVKRIAGMVPCAISDSILSSSHLESELCKLEMAKNINSAFLAPLESSSH